MTQNISRTTTTVSPTKTRANVIGYATVSNPLLLDNFSHIASHMFSLMLRNVASDGWVFEDPAIQGHFSKPGCIIASPSFPASLDSVDQNYVYNWTRDSAITAVELAARNMPEKQPLIDYVNFAKTCQDSGPCVGHACYTIEGRKRPWTEQSDGPALQTLAILRAYSQLTDATKPTAVAVIKANINYLLANYDKETTCAWEDAKGYSFFARSVQLLCFREVLNDTVGLSVDKAAVQSAIDYLSKALNSHWDSSAGYYRSLLNCGGLESGLNADLIMASVY